MRLIRITDVLNKPPAGWDEAHKRIVMDISRAIKAICWPPGCDEFRIYPQSGKKRGEGNGVKPIKEAFVKYLEVRNWIKERSIFKGIGTTRLLPGAFDAYLDLEEYGLLPFVVEWETGNISSSHRAMNKMSLALKYEKISGGMLILPTRKLYQFLTDRVGSYEELEPYFPLWGALPFRGYLSVAAVEQDADDFSSPRIGKGTDGRNLM